MIGKNHRIVNAFALFPIGAFINRYFKKEVKVLLPDDKIILASLIFTCLFVYFYASTLPDIDNKKWFPFKHRTYFHTIRGLLPLNYFAFNYKEDYPFLFFVLISFSLGFFLHLFFDDFSTMGCDMIYPFIGYREYYGGKIKYRKGLLHFELYKVGDKSEKTFVVIVCLTLIILSLILLLY